MIGTNGRLYADRQECQIYLRKPVPGLSDYEPGWTVKYTTDLTKDRWFYLRGEEYSAQVDDFIKAVAAGRTEAMENDFQSAALTDLVMAMIRENAETSQPVGQTPAPRRITSRKRWFGR